MVWNKPKRKNVATVPAVQQTTNHSAFTTTNKYNGLENDTLDKYGNYKSRWMLDTAASGNYADKKTRIPNQQEIMH